jgi:hypothetical protein
MGRCPAAAAEKMILALIDCYVPRLHVLRVAYRRRRLYQWQWLHCNFYYVAHQETPTVEFRRRLQPLDLDDLHPLPLISFDFLEP